jgi:DNA-binding protein HU-beta
MTKTELIKAIASEAGVTITDATEMYKAFETTVRTTLKSGETVDLGPELGKIMIVERAARVGVNPRTGEKMDIKASKNAKLKAGTRLKKLINEHEGVAS